MPPTPAHHLWNALIRTHHITSRKKVSKLKAAAKDHSLYVLLRSGGVPGMMYVEGHEQGVQSWVATVHGLRYKDYQLVRKPAAIDMTEPRKSSIPIDDAAVFEEEESVAAFGQRMAERGLLAWWRAGMGYTKSGSIKDPS